MKVLSTEGLTKLIQLIKSAFISVDDTVSTNTVTLATVATSGSYNDLSDKPTIPTTTNLANKDLSNLSSTGEARFTAKVSTSACVEVYPVIQTYQNGASWYRIYSDGWCEMGGSGTASSTSAYQVVLPKTMADTNYSVMVTSSSDTTQSGDYFATYENKTTTTFDVRVRPYGFTWRVDGYLTAGQY